MLLKVGGKEILREGHAGHHGYFRTLSRFYKVEVVKNVSQLFCFASFNESYKEVSVCFSGGFREDVEVLTGDLRRI